VPDKRDVGELPTVVERRCLHDPETGSIVGVYFEFEFPINYAKPTTAQQSQMAENLRIVCDS
jgi:hypothetical protein